MSWTNQGGFPSGGTGGDTLVQTTINNFTDAPITTYPTYADLIIATPAADEIGIVASNSGDGYGGTSWFWDFGVAQWKSASSPVRVNGVSGPIITLDASNIEPTGTRQWVTPAVTQSISDNAAANAANAATLGTVQADIAALESEQATQDSRLTATESATQTNTTAIANITNDYGGRLTTAETNIAALQTTQGTDAARIVALEASQGIQDIEIGDLTTATQGQAVAIADLQAEDAALTTRIAAAETVNATQTTQINGAISVNNSQNSRLSSLETSRTATNTNVSNLTTRVTAAEGVNTTQAGQITTINTTLSGLPGVYQTRSEKDQPGGYVGLLQSGTINPAQLPFTFEATRDITPVNTLAERDILAASWGIADKGRAVLVANGGNGQFFVWDGSDFLDFTGSITVTSSDDVQEGTTNLFYSDGRVAASPAVTANTTDIAALEVGQAAQDTAISALQSGQTSQGTAISALQSSQTSQDGEITALETSQAAQDITIASQGTAITALQDLTAEHTSDIGALQTQNTAQDAAIAARLTSFNGRTGPAILPTAGDYNNSQTTNVAVLATGANTAIALDNLKTDINAVAATAAAVTNKVTKGGDAGAFSMGTTDASNVTLIAGNAARIVLNASTGLAELKGATESTLATSTVTLNPSTGAFHVDPNVRVPLGWVDGCQVTFSSSTSVVVAAGQIEIGGRLITIPNSITKNAALSWVAGTGAGGQIGTWGNGSQFVYVGHNATTAAVDVFVSNVSNATSSNGFTLKLLLPLYVESSTVKSGTHNAKLRKFVYNEEGRVTINPVTTAGGGLIAVPIPVYPLLIFVRCSQGQTPTIGTTVACRFSRNSANNTPAISQPSPQNNGWDADIMNYYDGYNYIDVTFAGEIITGTAQVRAVRLGTYGASNLPTLIIDSYSWS